MLTLPPKRRGREQAACWQLLRFAAGLTRPDGTSARVFRQLSPVETTHPHRTEPPFGSRMLTPLSIRAKRGPGCRRERQPPGMTIRTPSGGPGSRAGPRSGGMPPREVGRRSPPAALLDLDGARRGPRRIDAHELCVVGRAVPVGDPLHRVARRVERPDPPRAPRVGRRLRAARRVLPLGLGRQAAAASGRVCLSFEPGDAHAGQLRVVDEARTRQREALLRLEPRRAGVGPPQNPARTFRAPRTYDPEMVHMLAASTVALLLSRVLLLTGLAMLAAAAIRRR